MSRARNFSDDEVFQYCRSEKPDLIAYLQLEVTLNKMPPSEAADFIRRKYSKDIKAYYECALLEQETEHERYLNSDEYKKRKIKNEKARENSKAKRLAMKEIQHERVLEMVRRYPQGANTYLAKRSGIK